MRRPEFEALAYINDQMREDSAKQLGLLQAVITDLASDIMKTLVLLKMNTTANILRTTSVEEEMGYFL